MEILKTFLQTKFNQIFYWQNYLISAARSASDFVICFISLPYKLNQNTSHQTKPPTHHHKDHFQATKEKKTNPNKEECLVTIKKV